MNRPRSVSEARLLFVSAVAIAMVIVVAATAVTVEFAARRGGRSVAPGVSQPVSTSTDLTASRGAVVYSDNFRDPTSGWTTLPAPIGATYGYTPTGLQVVVATGNFIYWARTPYDHSLQQVSISVTATKSAVSPPDSGFGVFCRRGIGSVIQYELYVDSTAWYVFRRDGVLSDQSVPYVIKQGTPPATAGTRPITLVGVCATEADGLSTRLVLFIEGTVVADITDTATILPGQGWLTGLLVAGSDKAASTMTATNFEVRNVAG